ncbi:MULTISPECIES: primosomal replication protein N [Edwardsiella]|uniref:Replication restart protein PriB n=1 Tax=Edwardsiella anguillarum TaxID=1821960 RepID=A0ABY8SK20_9GAMM|nr:MULTISPECIES: primosomal replication protein N [Edwardsiella]GAJ67124.1 primosomal replication protein N [Edwardsiella piscicida]KAB0592981.1 primosomal replication protein N [Edwardsiella anguillarum]MDA6076372.1 primosomal replication protein N [Edwardsiella anguillarum]RFT00715.1 primosomal replication protein N [Edwardsiella anguillarum]UBU94822.1 primosomal replication protein N [Edwardsiella sp. LADL05-105]
MTVNRLVLAGTVCKVPIRKVSPSGIPHCQFVLEHRSQQQEAGFSRQAWCRMPVIVSGAGLEAMTHRLTVGSALRVHGFVSCHMGRNGLNKLVLHAEQIELIDSGD